MTYQEARAFTDSLKGRGIVPGLTNIQRLLAGLGDPQDTLNIVHIAGTNGKGSVGAFLGSVLRASGKSCARFVSPAVEEYLEAFTIDGIPVTEEEYAGAVKDVQAAVEMLAQESIFPTAFEAETAAAFLMFSRRKPDYALIECGMGGLLDSTNVIEKPILSVLVSISEDHKAFLGSTLAEIAAQKCGIIKEAVPVVTCEQPPEAAAVIEAAAAAHHAPLYTASVSKAEYNADGTDFILDGNHYRIRLCGTYQPQNAAIAVKAAEILGFDYDTIRAGLADAVWGCRFERIGKYILDGAHNEGAARELARSMAEYLRGQQIAFICGVFRDKDYPAIARLTAPYADIVFTVTPPSPRALENTVLAEVFRKYGTKAEAVDLVSAIARAEKYDAVVVFGTLSILGEAKRMIVKERTQHGSL